MAIRKGPYTVEDSTEALKLEGPTLRIKAGDGSIVLAASLNAGGKRAKAEIEAAVALAVKALNATGKGKGKE
ncbi:MAG: hypothetical protein ACR2QF_11890 [Geminicoccaceae bacterium]